MLLGDRLDHIFEERHPVGGGQRVGELPVHLELAVGVLVIVLVRRPAELEHGIADLADHVVAAHQRRLVVAGLRLGVRRIADRRAVGAHQEELAFDAGLHCKAGVCRLRHHLLENVAGRLLDQLAVHVGVGGEPADLALPGKLDQARWIGNGEHVGIGGRHVEPAGETGEAGAVLGHVADRGGRRQLGAQRAEQIDIGNQEIFDPALAGLDCKIDRHVTALSTPKARSSLVPIYVVPGIQFVPASGTLAMAAASTVSATRSSGSRLRTWLLPQARAMVCVSSVSTER